MENDRIYFKKHSDICWTFSDDNRPYISLETSKKYNSSQIVDPFPCYTHNEELVRKEIEHVETTVPLKYPPRWFILPYDTPARTNGSASDNKEYEDGKSYPHPNIILAGKRIIIMPAMTRYLVAHEYAHVIDFNIQFITNVSNHEFDKKYAEFRGIPENHNYGALNWHKNIGEIIANDIRIILLKREVEFWPHEVEHPFQLERKLEDFWWDKIKALA